MVSESVQPSTIAATRSPKRSRISSRVLGAALVLDGVVQQCRDGFVLVSAVLDHDRCDGEQVRDIGDVGAPSPLLAVQLCGENKSVFKTAAHRYRHTPHYSAAHPVDNYGWLPACSAVRFSWTPGPGRRQH